MPSATAQRGRAKIKTLEHQRAKLEQQEADLSRTRQHLLLKNAILKAYCDALNLLQAQWGLAELETAAAASENSTTEDHAVEKRFRQLLQEEICLANELTFDARFASCSLNQAVLPDPGPDALSPGDPLQLFRTVVAEGPMPDAATWETVDIARMCREAVMLSSLDLHLQQVSSLPPLGQATTSAKQLCVRYVRALISTVVAGRAHLLLEVCCWDLAKLEYRPEYETASVQASASIPLKIQLTEVQKELLSAGWECFMSMKEPLQQHLRDVTAQMATAAEAAEAATAKASDVFGSNSHEVSQGRGSMRVGAEAQGGATSRPPPAAAAQFAAPGTAAAAVAGPRAAAAAAAPVAEPGRASTGDAQNVRSSTGGAASTAAAAAAAGAGAADSTCSISRSLSDWEDRQRHLDTQQNLAARLKLLMSKEHLLVLIFCCLILCSLTAEQIIHMSAIAWPYTVRPLHVAKEVHRMKAEELQQLSASRQRQQQQQRQQRRKKRKHEDPEGSDRDWGGEDSSD